MKTVYANLFDLTGTVNGRPVAFDSSSWGGWYYSDTPGNEPVLYVGQTRVMWL